MIRKILYIIFASLMIWGCSEEENPNMIPDDVPRFNELKEQYRSVLVDAEYGWKAIYRPTDDAGGFKILMKFMEDGTVIIESDLTDFTETADKVFYSLSGATFPELIFETYCVWHQFYEVADGQFQFRIIDINESAVKLGKIDDPSGETEITFTAASADDFAKMDKSQEIVKIIADFYDNTDEFFKVLEFTESNTHGFAFFVDELHQLLIDYTDENNKAQTVFTSYMHDENGIYFPDPIEINGMDIERFDVSKNDDGSIRLSSEKIKEGRIYSTDVPEFEFPGVLDMFKEYSFGYIVEYSDALDSLNNKIQAAGVFTGAQIYRNYRLSQTDFINSLTFIIYEDNANYDFYSFFISQFQETGVDKIRFVWNNTYSENVDTELFTLLRDYILFFFDKNGFKILPYGTNFAFISNKDPKKFFILVPAG